MITEKEFERALIFCGTGMGIHIAASKCPGVHAGVVESVPAAFRAITGNGFKVKHLGDCHCELYDRPEGSSSVPLMCKR